jgi:hypothetical protein
MTDSIDAFRRLFAEHDLGLSDALVMLNSHFRQAMQTPGDSAVVYSHDGQPALALTYNRRGEFVSVDVRQGLRDDDLARLTAAFTAPRPRHVMTVVLFSNVPTVGSWRYRDRFQVFPLPSEAPRPPQLLGGVHPLLLEVAYDGSHNDQVDEYRGGSDPRGQPAAVRGVARHGGSSWALRPL